ncbi:hypothetical protein [Streptomyces sp.]|uniref:hypothetical protein n=1 Tax=Streptomyces sp. TaxID=1931 RepID=UPI002810AD81|nr:hypothetical protein [Streptomyces sp.]
MIAIRRSRRSQPSRRLRSAAAVLAVLAAFPAASGCGDLGTQSPPRHADRLDKAARVARFHIALTQDVWDRTRLSGRDDLDDETFGDVEPRGLKGELGRKGLVEVTLTGPQLVAYLRKLDYDAHGGMDRDRADEPLARRVYDAVARVVDRMEPGRAPTAVPYALVEDAATAGSSASPGVPKPAPPTGGAGGRPR